MQLDVQMVIYYHKKKSQDMIDSNFYNLTSLFVSINILYYMSIEIIQSSLIFLLTNMVIMILIFYHINEMMDVAFATQVHVKCEKIVFRMFFLTAPRMENVVHFADSIWL